MGLFESTITLASHAAHQLFYALDQGSASFIGTIMKQHYVTGKNYDLGDGEIGRIAVMTLRSIVIPLGDLGGGIRLKGLVILLLSHYLGRIVFPCLIPFENYLHRIYRKLKAK